MEKYNKKYYLNNILNDLHKNKIYMQRAINAKELKRRITVVDELIKEIKEKIIFSEEK